MCQLTVNFSKEYPLREPKDEMFHCKSAEDELLF